ncbi:helix-turn-helix domain-containing protein [Actinophytocola algeriensis]|uniref:Transposase n=1 Tax=Actinophytocola algeriensis TaxID=1768010 RepID=A0A7W7Q3Q4_9PSEU|nr:helix-turn-helix domain-containing protein [Actinophytocola algeriensis]MBB4906273.1 transposase [Actinophytocola algeriensis]MBE1472042.1 transposase [Actinophytocola algeriensis]
MTRTAKDPVRLRRAIVVMMSGQGQAVRDITSLLQVSAEYVRDVIHAFNERGFDALDPKWSGGRPKTIGEQVRERICLIAKTPPADWGITAFSTWSLAKLREHLIGRGTVAAISRETLRRILRAGGVMHMLAALDLATGKIFYRIRDRKRHREFLGFLKTLRARCPARSFTS